jgi:hypothetical protein
MRELITIKGTQRACLYGLGVLGLLGPSPPAKSKSKSKSNDEIWSLRVMVCGVVCMGFPLFGSRTCVC